jgi:hypothetical protein
VEKVLWDFSPWFRSQRKERGQRGGGAREERRLGFPEGRFKGKGREQVRRRTTARWVEDQGSTLLSCLPGEDDNTKRRGGTISFVGWAGPKGRKGEEGRWAAR